MLKHASLIAIALLAGVAFAVVPAEVQAAASTTVAPPTPPAPVVSPPKFPPRRAPLAPPAMNDVGRAYEFRTQINGNPQCQRFATEADGIFLDGALDDAQKAAKLKALGEEAKASDCLASATTY